MEEAARRHVLYMIISSFKSIYFDACMFNNLCSFHKGKNVHIVDLYVVPTWKDKDVDPVHCLPVSSHLLSYTHQLKRTLYVTGTEVNACILFVQILLGKR